MKKHQTRNTSSPIFNLPMLEKDLIPLERFMAQHQIPPGLPLFVLGVQLTFCRDLLICLWGAVNCEEVFLMEQDMVMGCLRLLRSRLMLISNVFEHGIRCCENHHLWTINACTDFVFTVQNQYPSIEDALTQPIFDGHFPLLAARNSVNSCIGVIECLKKCGGEGDSENQNYFAGTVEATLSSFSMVEEQLGLIITLLDFAQDKSFRIEQKEQKNL